MNDDDFFNDPYLNKHPNCRNYDVFEGDMPDASAYALGGNWSAMGEAPEPPEPLHVCAECKSEFVHPVDWREVGNNCWEVTLRCPNCEHLRTDVFSQEACDVFDVELDQGTDELVEDLKQLAYANLAEEVERFTAALEADAILPEDF